MTKKDNYFEMKVEIPKNSSNKIEYNKTKKRYELDRVLSVAMSYPEEYGVIEETLAPDGDELDVICLTLQPTFSGLYVPIRIIGVLKMIDSGEADDKILAVNAAEPRLNNIKSLTEVGTEKLAEIKHFFLRYKELEKKEIVIQGWGNQSEAEIILQKCQKLYQKYWEKLNQGISKKELLKLLESEK